MRKRLYLVVGAVIVIGLAAALLFFLIPKEEAPEELTLNDYPKLFEKEVVIVIGENAIEIEYESAEAIAENLYNSTGNMPVLVSDAELTEEEKAKYNLIIVGSPGTSSVLKEVYSITDATPVTEEYPGEGKGVLEILRNPWNVNKTMLLVEGSDAWGVKAGSLILAESQRFKNEARLLVDWEEYTGVDFPIDNAEEAIKYAKTDIDVKKFTRKWSSQGYNVEAHAKFSDESNHWFVQFHVVTHVEEIWFSLEIDPNGTIIHKGGTI